MKFYIVALALLGVTTCVKTDIKEMIKQAQELAETTIEARGI